MNKSLEIVYQDENFIAVNKPHDILVHKTKLAKNDKVFVLQLLRDQVGFYVYPAHRLDRKTSGVLLFAKTNEVNTHIQKLFQERKVKKTYLAIVRGHTDDEDTIDYALAKEGSNLKSELVQEAITHYKLIRKFEIDEPLGKHKTNRYSLIRLTPETGRFHQLRKHMAHIFHPIIGDRPHGCNKQNRMWKHGFLMDKMLLHAETLSFHDNKEILIKAEISREFKKALDFLDRRNINDS